MNPQELAATIDHTLLKPEATPPDVDRLCDEAIEFHFAGVCVNPCHVRQVTAKVSKARVRPLVVSVTGFPLGAGLTDTKADEARRAIDDGADEIDMVINLGALIAGNVRLVRDEIAVLARVVHSGSASRVLKVILETGALTDERIIAACRCCAEGEADFVKTSTGFHSSGGATVEHVRLLNKHSAPLRVKASGGIRTAQQALAMIEAGASRIGTSSGPAILRELVESTASHAGR